MVRTCVVTPPALAEAAYRFLRDHGAERVVGARRVEIQWSTPRAYTNDEPARRRLDGDWRSG